MKKSFMLQAAAIAFAIALSSCGTTKEASDVGDGAKKVNEVKKIIGAEGVARPDWVMGGAESKDGIYAVGSAKFSDMQNSLKAARTNGRAELANTVQATVKSAMTTYAEDTGISGDVVNYMEQATVQKTDAMLAGSQQKDYWVGPDGTVYTLMFLPYNALVPAANEIVKDYIPDAKSVLTEEKVQAAVEKYNLNN